MGVEADALCGAGYGERSPFRTKQRNGYRHRQFDTRTGSLDLANPKLRHGSNFPDWLLERRKHAARALTTVVATCYLLRVSTRRMDKLVETWAPSRTHLALFEGGGCFWHMVDLLWIVIFPLLFLVR